MKISECKHILMAFWPKLTNIKAQNHRTKFMTKYSTYDLDPVHILLIEKLEFLSWFFNDFFLLVTTEYGIIWFFFLFFSVFWWVHLKESSSQPGIKIGARELKMVDAHSDALKAHSTGRLVTFISPAFDDVTGIWRHLEGHHWRVCWCNNDIRNQLVPISA